ncbi:MAG: AurF N-oxygenase family protein [Actinomycetota bacterium]
MKAPRELDREVEQRVADKASYNRLIDRLSVASVEKHYEPYIDIDWDSPEMSIDPDDERWALPPIDPLGGHAWYQAQPPEIRAQIGLWRIAAAMKIGVQFENLLKRGLLAYALPLPNGSSEFRYVYHEVIEEGHHGMMFQEFVNRTGMPIPGLPPLLSLIAPAVVPLGRWFPGLFFFFVLGGEDPIDHVQRKMINRGDPLHPLVERIIRIHVAEEARHLSFARHYLRRRLPRVGWARRQIVGIAIPIILGIMARQMLAPSPSMIRRFKIPKDVIDEVYRNNPDARAEVSASLDKVRSLAYELKLINRVNRPIWKAFQIWKPLGEAAA